MNKEYVLNLETGKIQLQFTKEEYNNLAAELKQAIKSNFLFSRKQQAWVSRAKEPNLYRALKLCEQLGLTEEKRINERSNFAEQLKKEKEKLEHKINYCEHKMQIKNAKAEQLTKEFKDKASDIAWVTQPNINSSAGRAFTNQRNRVINKFEKGIAESIKAEYYQDRKEKLESKIDKQESKITDPIYLEKNLIATRKTIKKLIARLEKDYETNKDYLKDQLTHYQNIEQDIIKCKETITQYSQQNLKVGDIVEVLTLKNKVRITSLTTETFRCKDINVENPKGHYNIPYTYITGMMKEKEEEVC